jgi:uncharacterized membrane protein
MRTLPPPLLELRAFLRSRVRLLNDPYVVIVLVAFIAYGISWSYITVARYYSLYAAVYDLGLFGQKTWWFLHPGAISPLSYVMNVVDEPFEAILAPTTYLGYPGQLILQSFAIGFGALPLFSIATRALKSRFAGLATALAYLLYFPLGGLNWFDIHFIAFFIPLFLLGVYCLTKRAYRFSLVLLLVAGSTEYPTMILVILFAVVLLLEWTYDRFIANPKPPRLPLKLLLLLLASSSLFFLYQYAFLQNGLGPLAFAETVHTTPGSTIVPLDSKVISLALILAPSLFLVVFSPRWSIMLAPFAYLILVSSYLGYSYPYLFQTQYASLYVPFIFLGFIDGLRWLTPEPSTKTVSSELRSAHLRRGLEGIPRRPAVAVVLLLVCMSFAAVYQPYGPYNSLTEQPFHLSQTTAVNMTLFNEALTAESIVPRSTPYVLFQNDMVTMLPRPLAYSQTPEVSGIENWLTVNESNALTGTFPLSNGGVSYTSARVTYMVDNPFTWGFMERGVEVNDSMAQFVTVAYRSGAYGILGEVYGMLVLEYGYTGPPAKYIPYRASFPAVLLESGSTGELTGSPVIDYTNSTGPLAWNGPFASLSPGTYTVQFSLMSSNRLPSNHVTLAAVGNGGGTTFGSATISGSSFDTPGVWTNFNFTFVLNNTVGSVSFPGLNVNWAGTLSLRYLVVKQDSPGTPTFT